ncbi:unnamed protein product [Effrenium voratum]|nr:unnamed protein product [Effrenium voratum]
MDRPGWERMFAQPGVPAPDASSTSSASEDQEEGEEEVPERYEGDMFGSDDEYKGWLDQIPSPTMPQAFGGRTSVASPFSAGPGPRNCLGFWERNHQTAQKAFGEFRLVCAKHLAKSSRADVIEAVGSSGQASILQPAQLVWTAAKTHKKFMFHPLILDNKARVAVVESLAPAQLKELCCDVAAVSATSSTLVEELGLQATRQSPTGPVLEEETTVAATMPPLLRLPTDAEVDAHIMAKNEKQVLCYVPNSGDGLKRLTERIEQWDVQLKERLLALAQKKQVVLMGDLNVAHRDQDIWNAEAPHALGAFTYWSVRAGNRKVNRGLRLDYVLVSESLVSDKDEEVPRLCDAFHLPSVATGDHCPVGAVFLVPWYGSDRSLFFAAVNNELGMTSKDVEALCDINRSTKPSQEGKIGKKGVGWKAVFAVSDQPTVLSGAFRFCFDVRHRGRLGYVTPDELSLADVQKLPSLLQEASANTAQAATVLYLPLRGGPPTEDGSSRSSGTGDRGLEAAALIRSSVQRLLACPTWLLFLRQLRRVAWQDATGHSDSRFQNVSVERRGDSLLIRSHSEGATQLLEEINYFVHRKKADVPKELLPAGVDEKRQEEVVIAFRKEMEVKEKSEADPVFCFLPVRAVGFRFSLQAPWALTSNREDFHLEDPRNVWLRAVAAEALAEAITASRRSNVLSLLDARQVLEPFWRRLLEDAVKSLGDAPVVPVVGENQLYRPSEVLVPPQALVRCPGAMRFLQSLAPGLWPLATGKRLASVESGEGTEVAEENARRLLSLKAEPLTGRKMKLLVNCASRELQQSCRAARASNLLSQLLELLNALLQAASQPEGEIPAFFKAKEGEGPERLVDLVAELQQIKVIPLDMGHTQEPVMTSLAEGDVFLPSPGAGSWCPGLDKATASALLPHKGIRVFDAQAWRMLPTSSQGLLRQLGIREATLMEAAATVVRVHALQLDESARLAEFSSSFAKPGSEAAAEAEARWRNDQLSEEAELQVMWAGLEAVRSARESCLTSSGMPVAQAESKLNPAECCAPIFGPEKSPLQLGAAALGSVLWLATRSVEGSLLLRRAPALSRPSFLGVAVESPDLAANEEDIQEQVPGESPGLRPAPSKPPVAMPAPSSTSAQDSFENALRWEAFLADLTTVQPAYGTIPLGPVAACRLFRENESWLPDLEVPVPAGQPGPGPRISSYFRRGDFEPVVGEAGLPYIDAPDVCKPLLEMLRIRCTADFESLAVALSCWVAKEPPPMCAPKGLMHALLSRAISERPAASLLMNLKSKIFLPGKGPIDAHQAIWSAGDSDFVRRACDLADAPVLQDIYGEALKCWFCDFLNVRTSPGVFQLLQVLRRLVPAQAGGTPPSSSKPTLSFLRQLYAELFFQLQEGLRASEVLEQKRRRLSVSATEGDSLPAHVARIFKDSRFIILPQARGRPWKFLTSGTAYWCVDPALADLPCSKFALSNFYDVKIRSKALGRQAPTPETYTRQARLTSRGESQLEDGFGSRDRERQEMQSDIRRAVIRLALQILSQDVSLYACGPSDFLASPQALQEVGLALAKRQASVPKGSLLASEGLARRAADFAEAVLRPLARFFQVPLNSLAVAVGPSIGRGRNVHGLICFSLPDGDQRSNLCLWFCEMCRLLASNAAGDDFSMGEVASALTAQHMKQFLQFQATARRRRR